MGDQELMESKQTDQAPEKIVVGANQLAHFNVRCPSCAKLFRIDSREISSSSPYFDCTTCKSRFTFDYPPANVNRIETRVVSQKDTFQLEDSVDRDELSPELRKCPKCHGLNPQLSKECIKCGVVFEKVDSVPASDAALGALPSLVKAWQDLMSDYNNLKKHLAFVNRCEDLQALPYALKKYQSLKEAQPQDDVAQQMFHQVIIKNLKGRAEQYESYNSLQRWLAKINWVRVLKLMPLIVGFALVLAGLSGNATRNIAGIGAAILFLTIGLTVFFKGRLSLDDFW